VNTALWQPYDHGSHDARCWMLSIVLHVTAIGVALALFSDLHLAAQSDPFRWQVSVIGRTHPSAVQETTAPTAPIAPSVDATTPAKAGFVPHQAAMRPVTAPVLPKHIPARPDQSVDKQNQPALEAIRSSNVPPQATAPANSSQSTSTETTMPAPSSSPPSEHTPSAASSASTVEPAMNPSRDASMVARVPLATPADVAPAPIPEASSSTAPSPNPSPPVQEARMSKPDFSWLTNSLRNRVQQSQKYSTVARLNGLEGRVVLRITVKDNGELLVAISTSSGHALLDQDAVEQITRLSPLPLLQPLGRDQRVFNLPIIYSLSQ
jgi:periplasmic protein TonB